jgi:hypothetical protein
VNFFFFPLQDSVIYEFLNCQHAWRNVSKKKKEAYSSGRAKAWTVKTLITTYVSCETLQQFQQIIWKLNSKTAQSYNWCVICFQGFSEKLEQQIVLSPALKKSSSSEAGFLKRFKCQVRIAFDLGLKKWLWDKFVQSHICCIARVWHQDKTGCHLKLLSWSGFRCWLKT